MTHRTISLLFLVLLVLPCFAASKYESKITSLEGEKWWGGAVGLGARMPFEGDLRLFDLSAENLNNQNVPLLLSSEAVHIQIPGKPQPHDTNNNAIGMRR